MISGVVFNMKGERDLNIIRFKDEMKSPMSKQLHCKYPSGHDDDPAIRRGWKTIFHSTSNLVERSARRKGPQNLGWAPRSIKFPYSIHCIIIFPTFLGMKIKLSSIFNNAQTAMTEPSSHALGGVCLGNRNHLGICILRGGCSWDWENTIWYSCITMGL